MIHRKGDHRQGDGRARVGARMKERVGARMALALGMTTLSLVAACAPASEEDGEEANASVVQRVTQPATIGAALAQLDEFSHLSRALRQTGVMPLLSGKEDYTLFAPRDTAFAKMTAEERAALFAPESRAALTRSLRGLIAPGVLRADELKERIRANGGPISIRTLDGGSVTIAADGPMLLLTVGGGKPIPIGMSEAETDRGSFYIIDSWPG